MCLFVSIGIEEGRSDSFVSLIEAFRFGIRPIADANLRKLFATNDRVYVVSWGGCSCGLLRTFPPEVDYWDKLRVKYERRGWSQTKIERALADSRRAYKSKPLPEEQVRFYECVTNAVHELGPLSVFARWGHDDLTDLEVRTASRAALTLAEFNHPLSTFPEDTVVSLTLGDGNS